MPDRQSYTRRLNQQKNTNTKKKNTKNKQPSNRYKNYQNSKIS